MTVRIGINGFGRMGRLGLRAGWGSEDLAAACDLKGILGYEERPLVSVDYLNDPRTSIVDA
ncbi:MAG: hypothetical protein DRQ45_01535, partial [Gammaproteobacteria bacterium]